jgi:hypothetical protein
MVETAKVDIRKLQQLNDRINQCLDALNQVRLSVHGLSHTTGAFPQIGQQQVGQLGFGGVQDPRFMAQGINPLAQAGLAGFAQPYGGQPYGGGLSHTGAIGQPFAQSPFAAWGPVNPMLAQQAAFAPFAQFGGLSHTGVAGGEALESFGKPTWTDPLLQAKVAQTFPYAQYAVPPIVSLY